MTVYFTLRELTILAWVVAGARNREIAKHIGRTEMATKNYLRAIYDKTGMSTRLELTMWVMEHIHEQRGNSD